MSNVNLNGQKSNKRILLDVPENLLQLAVKTNTGQSFIVNALSSWTIRELKEAIKFHESLCEIAKQRLIFQGKMLENERKITDYKITGACTIHLVLTL